MRVFVFWLAVDGVIRAVIFLLLHNFLRLIDARHAGLETATLGLEGRCSIQLSYKRIK